MPLLQTLEIHEVISTQAVDIQRATLKRQVRNVANGTRNFAMGLRRRMNALGGREGDGTGRTDIEQGSEGQQVAPLADAMPPAADHVDDIDVISKTVEVIEQA
jgi:hypothetical protein